MSRPLTPLQSNAGKSDSHRNHSRRSSRPFQGDKQQSQRFTQEKKNGQQTSKWSPERNREPPPHLPYPPPLLHYPPPLLPYPQSEQGCGHRERKNQVCRKDVFKDSSKSMLQRKHTSFVYPKFHQVMKLSKMSGNDIATEISADNRNFILLLNSEMKPDFFVLTLRVLAKLGHCNFTRIVTNILIDTCESEFLASLETYLIGLTSETQECAKANKFYWEDIDGFWSNLYDFFKAIVRLVPVQAHGKLFQLLELMVNYVIQMADMKKNYEIPPDVQINIHTLYSTVKKNRETITKTSGNIILSDFRNLSVAPTIEDLNDHHPFIRPCRTDGSYDSVEHYLDVQYRLLREDFMCPLRNGILQYKRLTETNVRTSQISEIRVFQKVKLVGPTVVKDNVGVTIFLGVLPKIKWNQLNLFSYGSLLCLTNDNFKSALFATVIERDPKLLGKGELIIEFCEGSIITLDMYKSEFVMIEPRVLFLPYYHALNSMRNMNVDNFPMKRYIIDAEPIPSPPKYLHKNTYFEYKGFSIPVLNEKLWPTARSLKFDEAQYKAFRCALLQELSVLHGPPGTGKTYMALQIAGTLLANASSWYNPLQPTPMIVICLTNHALDQFLEGILSYTESLIRVGEQTKNPSLAKYELKAVRDEYFKDEKNKHLAFQNMQDYQDQLKRLLYALKDAYDALKILRSNTCIVSPNLFGQYCNDHELLGLTAENLLIRLFGPHAAFTLLQKSVTHADDFNNKFTCLEMGKLNATIKNYENEIRNSTVDNLQRQLFIDELYGKLRLILSLRNVLQERLSHHPLVAQTSIQQKNSGDSNWELYCHWLTSTYEVVRVKIAKLEQEYQETLSQLQEFKQLSDLAVMRNSLVMGMTTTCAARLHKSLRALRAPIVIVEEAAEILEAHVICSLTEHCQQLILIGDHKQLRPKPATYDLEVNYKLNLSLFERIVNMRDQCTELVIQHRMRPEIAELLTPSIYERLENHESVLTFPAVMGVQKNLYFVDHKNAELGSSGKESKSNPFEVEFLLSFAKYLRLQGYDPHEITVLCIYSGQVFKFKEAKKSMPILRDVRVTTVDSYQGEEAKIILLSLVDNNSTGNIDFLATEKRVHVALSRAREGLYIMGNMNNLVTRNEIWPKIRETLVNNDAIGDSLILQCQIHTDQLMKVKCAADFDNCYDGCSRQSEAALPCGHICKKPCHILNRKHKDYVCQQSCLKTCARGHPCRLSCKDACRPCQSDFQFRLSCGHTSVLPCSTNIEKYKCTVQVQTVLLCGHTVGRPCHRDSLTYSCTHICKKSLDCGHLCKKKCHIKDDADHYKYICNEDCRRSVPNCPFSHHCLKKCHEQCGGCTFKLYKDRTCGHVHNVECSQDVEKVICTRHCKRKLLCGHPCKLTCNLPCGKCEEMVDKVIPDCGHAIKIPCYKTPTVALCKSKCQRVLACGHPCKAECCEPCTTKRCEFPRPPPKTALCQHSFSVPCYKVEVGLAEYADKLLQHCSTPCAAQLPCGHVCNGTCGSCKQGRIHELCREECNKILICGHKCTALCKNPCVSCENKCSLKCEHNECQEKCREPCMSCQEPCSWQCEHLQCTKLCSEICDRDPCNKPCPKQLKCGHTCIGFCGEPCPPLCRICDANNLPIFNPDENKPEPRFVFLADCGHSIESSYLEWNWQNYYRISIKVCPLCKTRITHCSRYRKTLAKDRKDMKLVEQKVSGMHKNLRADQQRIIDDIRIIEQEYALHFPDFNGHRNLYESLRSIIKARKNLGLRFLADIGTKLNITGMILHKVREIPPSHRDMDDWPVILNQMTMLITSLPANQNVSHQMIDEIGNELVRLHYMIQLCKLEREKAFSDNKNALRIEIIRMGLLNLNKFTKPRSNAIHKQLSELITLFNSSLRIAELKEMTIRVMGLNLGDWNRCRSGHIYLRECAECPSAPSEPN